MSLEPIDNSVKVKESGILMKTPTRFTFEKKLHTPPSGDRDIERSPPKKFLRGLSGRVFRKTPDLKNQQEPRFGDVEDSQFTPNFGLMMSKRGNIPKPLNLSKPISPPPSLKRTAGSVVSGLSKTGQLTALHSPVNIVCNNKFNIKGTNLTSSLLRESISDSTTMCDNFSDVNLMVVDEDYCIDGDSCYEEDSPTFIMNLERNIKKCNSQSGPKRYVGEKCLICEENISSTFTGEKVVESTCSHTSHYNCYLMLFETLYFQGKFPECKICGEISKPKDKDIVPEMVSKLLTGAGARDNSPSSDMQQQWIDLKSARSVTGELPQFTPREQLIRTADISCDGFRTPQLSNSERFEAASYLDSPLLSSPFINEPIFTEPLSLGGDGWDDHDETDECAAEAWFSTTEKADLMVNVKFPETDLNDNAIDLEILQDVDYMNGQEPEERGKLWKESIDQYIETNVDKNKQFGNLILFDKIMYSDDGEQWVNNNVAILFTKFLVLFDYEDMKILGKIPRDQFCQVIKFNEKVLLCNLKSTNIPEIYLRFSEHCEKWLLAKWKYCLENASLEGLPLCEVVTTVEELLREDIISAFRVPLGTVAAHSNNLQMPWKKSQKETPLKLIVCLNVSHADGEGYRKRVVGAINQILDELNVDDLLGIVVTGRDGNGQAGPFGTFMGMINKHWDGWETFLENLETVGPYVFQDEEQEYRVTLQTCARLASTSAYVDTNDHTRIEYAKQIMVFNNREVHETGRDQKLMNTLDMLSNDLKYEISQHRMAGIQQFLKKLHSKSYLNVTLCLPESTSKKMYLGDMAAGELQTRLVQDKHPHSNFVELEWFDVAKQQRICKTLELSDI
ncbi:cyclin-dependent protein serine/threonine kinase inhibiting protein FAR1 [Saccharomyces eubayanus]|uniref:cyclin-dependent protein serine/threonine kinase inhibiting protein FAR1 n=1 Tax=Saccharomyces eubayanus TaxID=1080349 RepID=UPI0006BF6E28|nr:FAR1-like protein [Saccharomyces eubayanus]KOG98463.1 FAR1-like protein [Saccharomyces eubayanus]